MKRDYIAIVETLKNEITFGHYQVNQQLPTESELINRFHSTRYAVRKALTEFIKFREVGCLSKIGTRSGK